MCRGFGRGSCHFGSGRSISASSRSGSRCGMRSTGRRPGTESSCQPAEGVLPVDGRSGSHRTSADQPDRQCPQVQPAGHAVELILGGDEEIVRLSVRDQGIGVAPESLDAIFEPFGRAANAEETGATGLGLGLYICRTIIERLGGSIWAESEGEGAGTDRDHPIAAGFRSRLSQPARNRIRVPSPSSPIAFTIGPLEIRWYALFIMSGIIVGTSVAAWVARRRGQNDAFLFDAAPIVVMAAVVGARLYYIALEWRYFADHPDRIIGLQLRGLTIHGALIGGIACFWWLCRRRWRAVFALGRHDHGGRADRSGDRALGQLGEPGSIRPADRACRGASDRSRPPARPICDGRTIPPDVPVRVDLLARDRGVS